MNTDSPATPERPHHGGPLKGLLGFFGAGLLVAVPLVVTIWVINLAYQFINGVCDPLWAAIGWRVPGLGFLTTLLLVLGLGFMATNVLGRRIIDSVERLIFSVPLVAPLYGAVKQALESFRTMKGTQNFKRVAYLRLPGSNSLLVGFVTGQCYDPALDRELTIVFLPFSPNPISGRVVSVPPEELVESGLTVEQVMKLVLSAGLVAPARGGEKTFD